MFFVFVKVKCNENAGNGGYEDKILLKYVTNFNQLIDYQFCVSFEFLLLSQLNFSAPDLTLKKSRFRLPQKTYF